MAGDASFHAAQIAVLGDVARGVPLHEALDAIVRLVEHQGTGMLCSVLLLDSEHAVLRHGAAPSLPREYVLALDGASIGPEAGSCGAAAYRNECIIVADIAAHPYWVTWRHLALPHGLVACWSTPIVSPERTVLGTFAMYYRERRLPTDEETSWVGTATHLASIAIVRDRDEQRLRRSEAHARQLARLYAVASSVSGTLVRVREPVQLYAAACQIAVEKRLAALAWVGVYHEDEDRIEPVARAGTDHGYIDLIMAKRDDDRTDNGSVWRALRTGTVAISEDIATDPTFYWRDEAIRRGLRSCAAFPFRIRANQRAIFVLYRDTPDAFGEEIDVLATLADNIAFAIESAENEVERRRLFAALREREERLRLLHDLGEAMRAAGDAEQVLAVAQRMLGRHLRASRCGYAELDPDGDHFTVAADYTDEGVPSIAGHYRLSDYGPRIAAELRRGGPAVVISDMDQFAGDLDPLKPLGIKALICCTLVRQGVPRAMMAVQQLQPRDWTPGEIRIVEEVVERCWAMIEQRHAETKLSRNQAMLRIAGRVARLGGWTVDVIERTASWSDEVCEICEVPAGTVLGLDEAFAVCAPEHRELVRSTVGACARNGTQFQVDHEIVTARGRRIWVRATGYAEYGPSGAVTQIHGALQDISERRLLEDQLRQAQKMEAVGLLASGVAHDFNNVLSVILSYSSFLVDSLPPGDSVRGDVREIQRAGERARQLTRQLLAFSRQQILKPRVVALDHILAGLETMLRRLIGERVALTCHTIGAGGGNIVADPGQIEQVVMNLVVNARDAMPAGGHLAVELARVELDDAYAASHPGIVPGPYVRLTVADSGIGMDDATRSRIFEPFFTTKEKGKGTGLGLSTVYGIVQQSGGHIWVDSEPGRGTTFLVYFPRTDAPLDAEVADAQPATLRGSETVLLVEDDDQVRKTIAAILRRAGYFVFEAPGADEAAALSARYSERIHLLVSDVAMPRADGPELAARLAPTRPGMGVLYVSGYAEESLTQDGTLVAGAAFLGKPITPDALLGKVREVLDGAPALAAEPARQLARRSTPQDGTGRHVLHLDDEEALVHLTARILQRLGYRVSSFTDPADALQAFRDEPASFDAVVTDVTMRGMTGFELVREIWTTRADVPVVVTSGDFRPEDIRLAEAMRIRDLVVKPDTVEELGRVLHELFSRPAG